ncbi:hypothetical protein [Pengzhenrongella phosphoraccumulans]|uniref:hypothetical protein n=1 Tax=Pengzhenrongella phosphoraccumulans TaxID=3114394 RepID=UPI00388E3524
MSTSAPEPATPWYALIRGLRQQVRDGTLSWWRGLSVMGALLLVPAGTLAVVSYLASLFVVGFARGGTGQDFQAEPGVAVVVVAAALGLMTVVVVAVGARWFRRRLTRHRARMQGWADAHGWAYTPSSSLLSSRWSAPGFRGRTRATDVLTRATPRGEVTSLTLGPGAGEGGWSRHAVMAVGPRWFPALILTPTTGRDRAAQAFGGQDITVESYDINARWRMRCADERFAHEVLHPRLLERLDRADVSGLCLLVQGRDVVVHAPGPTAFAAIEPMVDLVLDLVSLLPAYLADDFPPLSPEVPRRERRRDPHRMR